MSISWCFSLSGTASVAVAGIFAALRITKNKLSDHKFVFLGAGEVGMFMSLYLNMLHSSNLERKVSYENSSKAGFMRMKHRCRFLVTGQDWAQQVDLAAV